MIGVPGTGSSLLVCSGNSRAGQNLRWPGNPRSFVFVRLFGGLARVILALLSGGFSGFDACCSFLSYSLRSTRDSFYVLRSFTFFKRKHRERCCVSRVSTAGRKMLPTVHTARTQRNGDGCKALFLVFPDSRELTPPRIIEAVCTRILTSPQRGMGENAERTPSAGSALGRASRPFNASKDARLDTTVGLR